MLGKKYILQKLDEYIAPPISFNQTNFENCLFVRILIKIILTNKHFRISFLKNIVYKYF